MRKTAVVVASAILLAASTTQAQERRDTRPRSVGRPTVEFLIGPHFGSGELREFDDPITFEQDLDYSGYFLKTGLDVPLRSRATLLFRLNYDHVKSEGGFLFPFVDEFELQRVQNLYSFGLGFRVTLR